MRALILIEDDGKGGVNLEIGVTTIDYDPESPALLVHRELVDRALELTSKPKPGKEQG